MSAKYIQNYAMISKDSSSDLYFSYIDTGDHLAEYIFYRYDIPVHFAKEFSFFGVKYRIILGWISDEHTEAFVDAMKELCDLMPGDYEQYCRWMLGVGEEILKVIAKETCS